MPKEAKNERKLPLPYKILMRLEFFPISSPKMKCALCVFVFTLRHSSWISAVLLDYHGPLVTYIDEPSFV